MNSNLFGTDGIRGTVGASLFTPENIPNLGTAIGHWLVGKFPAPITVLIGHDTRESCGWIKAALQTGLSQIPITVIDGGVLPTPTVLQRVRQNNYTCGIVISASHNPYHDNGVKIMSPSGKISLDDELEISRLYSVRGECFAKQNVSNHIERTIVLDCANGATYQLAPEQFRAAGYRVVTIHDQPNGKNINDNCGALHPESLQQTVLAHNAHLGFAFDGDGDRVIAVNSRGEIKDGDDLIALLLSHPTYANTPTVVGTIMTNRGFELYLEQNGKQLIRANVGDKYVAEQLETHNLLIGGEPSGHVILRDHLPTGDGIFCALRVVEAVKLSNNWGLDTFTKFPQVMINVRVKERKDLNAEPLAGLIAAAHAALGPGRLVIRYSGTEPLLRIMAEAPEHAVALHSVQNLSEQITKLL